MLSAIKKPIKQVLAALHQWRRKSELEQTQPHVSKAQIAQGLRDMGVQRGDILFIHSSLKSLGYVEGGPKAVIEGLLEAVGPKGTLILPTYYMPGGSILGTCQMKDYVFDPRVHGTNMGALPEAFLQFEGVQRSIHPTHSVSAIGKQARYLTEAHHLAPSVFGKGSPWQRFHELNGKVLGLGISMGPVTFYHFVEDTMGERFPINVWLDETYRIPCKGWNGEDYLVPVRPFKPELPLIRIDHPTQTALRNRMWSELMTTGDLHLGKVGAANSWWIAACDFNKNLTTFAASGFTIYSK